MTIGLTPEQDQLAAAVADFAERHAPIEKTRHAFDSLAAGELPAWWDEFVGNGFHAVHLPEQIGGQGGTLIDTVCVVEAAATAMLPGPVLPTILAGAVASLAEDTAAAQALLARLAGGAPAALITDRDGLRATLDDTGATVSGTSAATPGLCAAQVILAPARFGGRTRWLIIDPAAPGAEVTPLTGTDKTVDVGALRLDGYRCAADGELTGIDDERARCLAVALTAGAASGVIRWCVRAVTEHLRTREQFGRPDRHVPGAAAPGGHAAGEQRTGRPRRRGTRCARPDESIDQHRIAAAAAALMAVAPAPDLVLDALTMFGAIGYTWEHDLHLYWRRATSLAASIGPTTRLGRDGWAS